MISELNARAYVTMACRVCASGPMPPLQPVTPLAVWNRKELKLYLRDAFIGALIALVVMAVPAVHLFAANIFRSIFGLEPWARATYQIGLWGLNFSGMALVLLGIAAGGAVLGLITPPIYRRVLWLFGAGEDIHSLYLHATSLYPLSGPISTILGVQAMQTLAGDPRVIGKENESGLGTKKHWAQIRPKVEDGVDELPR